MISPILARGGRAGRRAAHVSGRRHRVSVCAPRALGEPRAPQAIRAAAPFLLAGEGMRDGEYTDDEQRVLEHVARLAWALREDRERLTRRLDEVGSQLHVLAWTLDGQPAAISLASRRS